MLRLFIYKIYKILFMLKYIARRGSGKITEAYCREVRSVERRCLFG